MVMLKKLRPHTRHSSAESASSLLVSSLLCLDKYTLIVTTENNPEVMTPLAHKLGLSPQLSFHDVFSIDDPDMLAFIPRPALALLLCFPVTAAVDKYTEAEDASTAEYSGSGEGEEVIWYRQTISNACGLYGLLHGVSNGEARNHIGKMAVHFWRLLADREVSIDPSSDLAKLLREAIPLKPTERADLVVDSQALEAAHSTAAQSGDTAAPSIDVEVENHYVAFVKSKNGHLWELDGARRGPLDRGLLGPDDDVLSEKALDLGVKAFLKREEAAGGGELRFSLLALAPTMD